MGLELKEPCTLGQENWRNLSVTAQIKILPLQADRPENPGASWDLFSRPTAELRARYRSAILYGEFYYSAAVIGGTRLCLIKAFATKTSQVYGRQILKSMDIEDCFDGDYHAFGLTLSGNAITVSFDGTPRLTHTDTDGIQNKCGVVSLAAKEVKGFLGEVSAEKVSGCEEDTFYCRSAPEGILKPDKKALLSPILSDYDLSADPDSPVFYYTGNTWHKPDDLVMVRGVFPSLPVRVSIMRLPDDLSNQFDGLSDGRIAELAHSRIGYILNDSCETLPKKTIRKNACEPSWNEESCVDIPLIQPGLTSFKFRIPESFSEGIYAVKTVFEGGREKICYLNAPSVKWAQGDEGGIMTPGGWLRVSGCHLAAEGKEKSVFLALRPEDGNVRILRPSRIHSTYSLEFAVPSDLPGGTYQLFCSNGFGDFTAFCEPAEIKADVSPRDSWPKTLYNVRELGAAGDGRTNDTAALRAILKKAEEEGGGVIYFPAGRYFIDDTLTVPEKTVLRGESSVMTQIFITPFDWDYGELPEYVIKGTGNFAVEDLTFTGSRVPTLITAGIKDPASSKNIYIRGCRFHFNSAAGVVTGNWNGELYGLIMNECSHHFASDLLSLGGENIQITDNDFLASGRPVSRGRKTNCLIRNNKFRPHVGNWSQFGHLTGGIVEHNTFEEHTLVLSGDNLYLAGNTINDSLNNNREAFTTDLGSGRYNGTMRFGRDNREIVLSGTEFEDNSKAGFGLYIMHGKGSGQYRRIIENTAETLTLDLPFLISPDEKSVVSIVEIRNHMYLYGNTVYNSGAVQFYGMQTDSVIDGTDISRSFGIWGSGRFVYSVYQPNWYNSIINNKMTDGMYFWHYGYDAQSGNAMIKISARGGISGMNVCTLVRRNELHDNSILCIDTGMETDAMQDLIVEENEINDSETGILFGIGEHTVRGAVLSKNSCKNVGIPVAIPDEYQNDRMRILCMEKMSENTDLD